jgi:hypothetical protein
MANRRRGEVDVQLGGRTYTMRPTFAALAEIEDRTGCGLIGLLRKVRDHRVKDIATVVHCGISIGHGTEVEWDAVGEMIVDAGINNVVDAVAEFVNGALFADDPQEKKETT